MNSETKDSMSDSFYNNKLEKTLETLPIVYSKLEKHFFSLGEKCPGKYVDFHNSDHLNDKIRAALIEVSSYLKEQDIDKFLKVYSKIDEVFSNNSSKEEEASKIKTSAVIHYKLSLATVLNSVSCSKKE